MSALSEELRMNIEKHISSEEQTKKETKEYYERDYELRVQKQRDEAYYKGRKEGADEMTLENNKLREIIESLRSEVSVKGKKLVELQFTVDDL